MESLVPSVFREISLETFGIPLALLLGIDQAARQSLRTWIAVQSLEDATTSQTEEEEEAQRRREKKRKVLAALVLLALLLAEVAVILAGSKEMVELVFAALTACLLTSANLSLLTSLAGYAQVVYRRGSGGLRYRIHTPTRSSKLALLLPLAFAILITYQTMRTPAPFEHGGAIEQSGSTQEYTCRILLELLNTASVVYVTCSRVGGKTLSIRRLTIFFAAYEAFAVLLTTPLIFATTSSTSNPAAAQDQRLGFAEADFYPLTKTYGIPWAAFYAAPVGHYVAACLRFDYHQSATNTSSTDSTVLVLQDMPAVSHPSRIAERTGPGLLVPTSHSTPFSALLPKHQRTYFNLTFSITCTAYLVSASVLRYYMDTLLHTNDVGVDGTRAGRGTRIRMFEEQMYGLLALSIVLPILACALFLTARARGESKQLWSYEETWQKDAMSNKTGPTLGVLDNHDSFSIKPSADHDQHLTTGFGRPPTFADDAKSSLAEHFALNGSH